MKQKYTTLVIYNVFSNDIYLLSGNYKIPKKTEYILTGPLDSIYLEETDDTKDDQVMMFLSYLHTAPDHFEVLGEL